MRFKSFKGFGIGKAKEKPGSRGDKDPSAQQTAAKEEMAADQAKDEDEIAQKIKGLAEKAVENGDARPHGPLVELSVEPQDLNDEEIIDVLPAETEESQEQVKMVEAKAPPDSKPAPAPKAEAPADTSNTLSGLFVAEEEEENPLANLIKTLPDYNTHEIIEDLNEIKRIIHEWQRS